MEEVKPEIVIIHDNLTIKDPIVIELSEKYGKENVKLIEEPVKGIDYVLANLTRKIIVILDFDFGEFEINGAEIFEEIRKKTSLVYIIIWTSNNLNKIDRNSLVSFINHDALAFEHSTNNYTNVIKLVDKAAHQLEVRIDSILENWISKQTDEEKDKVFMITRSGEKYTLKDILKSIRKGEGIGLDIEKGILKLAVHLLTKQKASLND